MLLDGKIEKFLAVAQRGSMSQAAKDLYVSQPSLTTQIRKLEEEVGFTLFVRTPKGVELTSAGGMFYEDMSRVRAICEKAVIRGRTIERESESTLTIGLLTTRELRWIQRALDIFHATETDVEIQFKIIPHAFVQRASMLRDGIVDCFLHGIRDDMLSEDLTMLPLFETEECLALPANHELASHRVIRPGDLAGHTVLFPREGASLVPSGPLQQELERDNPGLIVKDQIIDAAFLTNLQYLAHPLVTLARVVAETPGIVVVPMECSLEPARYGLIYLRKRGAALEKFLTIVAAEWQEA
ncbi:LysR family transcriptional regulator [Adlercreutzia sp. R21]|uniref:LysR family transcriptional regulator n=1 Tax=Adlercreutzia wanghongyangiae TaxID=3111451 RepID=A0ABU6IJ77_9ACTN|nr:LysR family transcriptional regulator [Adlercreutzia sp. R21]MEC4176519.1 LysR family transcriptional regulator [Adlercreutzia sp. R7]MEC4184739.1 LysR family transcriptional regulator [Adlercreutzia sp. R21]